MLSEVAAIWFFSLVFEVPTSTMVTHYGSQQGDAVEGTPLWDIFLALVQWPIRHMLSKVAAIWFFFSILRYLQAQWLRIMRPSKRVPLRAPPFGTFFWLRFRGQSGTCCPREPQFGFFPLIFEVPPSTRVTHYDTLLEGAFNGTPLWDIFLAAV
jgi:hypothetical protein